VIYSAFAVKKRRRKAFLVICKVVQRGNQFVSGGTQGAGLLSQTEKRHGEHGAQANLFLRIYCLPEKDRDVITE